LRAQALLAPCLALPLDAPEPLLQEPDALAEQAAVRLELRLARPSEADAALLPLEVGPAADEPGGQMLELRQLDLQLTFEACGALGKDVEDQPIAIEHARLERALEVPLLAGRQCTVHEHELRT